jgi:hypothetical protein
MRDNTAFARRTAACAALLLLVGCAGMEQRPEPLSREEIVRMARAGEPAKAIIARLQATDTVMLLSAAEILKLAGEGVPTEALDWMQQAQIAEIRRRDAFAHMYGGGFPGYGAFGPCPPGWGARYGHPAYRLRSPFWPGC